jgi:homoserine dehydrogenase
MPPLNVALIGFGNVGGGVARLLLEQSERLALRAGRPIVLKRVVVRDPSRPRAVSLPDGILSSDVREAILDPQIDTVVELMGGTDAAFDVVMDALAEGKDVVTANKALLCTHGDAIFERARTAKCCVAFEASVAGGIPIIATIGQGLAANQIKSIEAILNGTSNFILTEMLTKRVAYQDVLAEAQRLGYAEADPTLDVDGTDAAQKLVLLTRLAFGTKVPLSAFPRQGIDTLELADLIYAEELGYRVKLLGVAKRVGPKLEMHVQPTLVRREKPIAQVSGAYNMVRVEGDAVGSLWLSGAGAGAMPTASAVVADLIDVATGRAARTFPQLDLWQAQPPLPIQPAEEIERRYYLRFNVEDRPHVFAEICDVLGRHGISLASIIQHEVPEHDDRTAGSSAVPAIPAVLMTHRAKEGQFRTADAELEKLACVRTPRVRLPVAD